jgi:hypothetical protein
MQIGNLAADYQAKTNEELLRLAMDSDQLSSDAQIYLKNELAKRGISAEQISSFREEEERYKTGVPEKPEHIVSRNNSYNIGPPLPAETLTAPWRPKVAGRIAFFFGPVAGALVVVSSLRRMGYQQAAKKVMLLALGATAAELGILFFIPEAMSRLVGFGAEIAFLLIFPVFMEHEFTEWQATHPSAIPSNGWKAIGWGLLGAVLFFVIGLVIFLGLSVLLPARQ